MLHCWVQTSTLDKIGRGPANVKREMQESLQIQCVTRNEWEANYRTRSEGKLTTEPERSVCTLSVHTTKVSDRYAVLSVKLCISQRFFVLDLSTIALTAGGIGMGASGVGGRE